MGRPSLLRLRCDVSSNEVFVGGRVQPIARGELL
jgi:predicted PhzF superfamily epimerase YddE/YHI9